MQSRGLKPVLKLACWPLLAFGILMGGGSPAPAESGETVLVALGQWQLRGAKPMLVVAFEGALTDKQKSMINGGFTTVSQLAVHETLGSEEDNSGAGRILYQVRCSAKFDAWTETYDIARLDDLPRPALVRRLSEYGDLCLKAEVSDLKALDAVSKDGGNLYAVLSVKQMSTDEAAKIKDWLIQQQSGVMQSLFSHMLGEMTLNQTAAFKISVPPRPRGGAQQGAALRFGQAPSIPGKPPGKG